MGIERFCATTKEYCYVNITCTHHPFNTPPRSCFVNELPADIEAGFRQMAAAIRTADATAASKNKGTNKNGATGDGNGKAAGERSLLVYLEVFMSSETGAPEKYADSKIMHAGEGQGQVAYEKCDAGIVYPLFHATLNNSYGKVLDRYVDKVFDMGYNGIYCTPVHQPNVREGTFGGVL